MRASADRGLASREVPLRYAGAYLDIWAWSVVYPGFNALLELRVDTKGRSTYNSTFSICGLLLDLVRRRGTLGMVGQQCLLAQEGRKDDSRIVPLSYPA